jgi:hypothetical protein
MIATLPSSRDNLSGHGGADPGRDRGGTRMGLMILAAIVVAIVA